ncbi:hypothetical protein QUB02_15785 [Microcoleus sp. D3_18_C1]
MRHRRDDRLWAQATDARVGGWDGAKCERDDIFSAAIVAVRSPISIYNL